MCLRVYTSGSFSAEYGLCGGNIIFFGPRRLAGQRTQVYFFAIYRIGKPLLRNIKIAAMLSALPRSYFLRYLFELFMIGKPMLPNIGIAEC
jgi:hypothetical protein